jgi:hypothetical protein
MNISDTASEIVELVQTELSNKTNVGKINRQVANVLSKIVNNFSDAEDDANYVVVVNLFQGVPETVVSNHPGLSGALVVCTDNISVADDEESAVIVHDDVIVVAVSSVEAQDDMARYVKSAHKFERLNS